MAILNIQIGSPGQSGQNPTLVYIDTNNTAAEVLVDGFLNGAVKSGYALSENQLAIVSTKTSPNAREVTVAPYDITFKNGDWSLETSGGSSILPVVIDSEGNMSGVNNLDMTGDLSGVVNINMNGDFEMLDGDMSGINDISMSGNLTGLSDIEMTGSISGVVDIAMTGNLTGIVDLDISGDLTGVNDISATGNIIAEGDVPGTDINISAINDSIVAGSNAYLKVTSNTNGIDPSAGGGNAAVLFNQSGSYNWFFGIYSSANGGDDFIHLAGGSPTSSDALIIDKSKNVLFGNDVTSAGNIYANGNNSGAGVPNPGAPNNFTVNNLDVTAESNAILKARVQSNAGGTVGGSAIISMELVDFHTWFFSYYSAGSGGDNKLHAVFDDYSSSDPMVLDENGNVTFSGNVVGGMVPYAMGQSAFAGGGFTQTVTVSGMIPGDLISYSIVSLTNTSTQIISCTAGTGSFDIGYLIDPGASVINWFAWH